MLVGVEATINSRPLVYKERIEKNSRKSTYYNCAHFVKRVRGNENSSQIQIGDVVLLQEGVTPRHTWKKARVEELILSRDEEVRTSVLRADKRTITRPVQLVIPLDVD
ncbi:hypothetical protein TNCV_1442961 [Trichonephila clavipes]|nr:hypothetical protein TNCV_1442961 [Trichonephila clavipes]